MQMSSVAQRTSRSETAVSSQYVLANKITKGTPEGQSPSALTIREVAEDNAYGRVVGVPQQTALAP